MGKLVFFLIIAVLVYWIIKTRTPEETETPDDDKAENATPKSLEEMVRCTHCGVHLPRSESVTSQGEFFCSNEHRLEHLDSSS
ncbi:uncharacterized protein SAMN05216302_100570 [Nitrosomonas aestuarii]|uniref:Preprotein translocase subunit YajC n=1 Tax=Nitrosomonas aestuarii TaxID=52441 RepID=A0A1I3Z4S7_9PROT|nr:PP0621 family protein [Nitrosomonas aestuarii]SFK38651.1 uncharacterized protein SAMN05216302_100570 [Nitrosomonas aestuarii]